MAGVDHVVWLWSLVERALNAVGCARGRLGQVARGKLAFVTLPDGKKDGKGLLSVTANPTSLASLFQVVQET